MEIQKSDLFPNFDQKLAHKSGVERIAFKAFAFIPRHAYLPLLHELRMAWRRVGTRKEAKKYKHARNLKVNVGCGPIGKSGWINADIDYSPGVNCIWDCRRSLPFEDASVKCIFTEHFVEHLDYCEEMPVFLSECHRVLAPKGIVRIIVPDGERYLQGYSSQGWDALTKTRPLGPGRSDAHFGAHYNTKMELINVVFRQYYEHKFAYDFETLEFLLRKHGFSSVCRQSFGQSLLSDLLIDKPERATESLYVEAVK